MYTKLDIYLLIINNESTNDFGRGLLWGSNNCSIGRVYCGGVITVVLGGFTVGE